MKKYEEVLRNSLEIRDYLIGQCDLLFPTWKSEMETSLHLKHGYFGRLKKGSRPTGV